MAREGVSGSVLAKFGKQIRLIGLFAVALALILVAVFSSGFDVQNLKLNSQNVWILQKASGQRYASVNTELRELVSVNAADNPSALTQTEKSALVFAGVGYADIDPAAPKDLTSDAAEFKKAPKAVTAKDAGENVVAFIAANDSLYVSTRQDGKMGDAKIVPMPDGNKTSLRFAAVTVATDGTVYVYAKSDQSVRQYSPEKNQWTGLVDHPSEMVSGSFQIAAIGNKWALLSDTAKLWVKGVKRPAQLVVAGESVKLQDSSPSGDAVYVASENGLDKVSFGSGVGTKVTEAIGKPAQPVLFNNAVYAAWTSGDSGLFYSSATNKTESLEYNGKSLASITALEPVIQSNGSTAVVNETQSGWAWRLPNGELIKSTQNWDLKKQNNCEPNCGSTVEEVTDPRPPVAEDDSFGVRAGALVSLPVILNDHDPNNDVLTIDPTSLSSLGGFGSARLSNDGQAIVVDVSQNASGGGSLKYKVTDGTSNDGRKSDFASVRLRVVAASANSAPQWCTELVDNCLATWPHPQVEPGGTVSIPVLKGWVDPEGDRMFISAAELSSGSNGSVGFTAAGNLVYKNFDSTARASAVEVSVHVSDIRGKETIKKLTIEITKKPQLRLTPFTVTTTVGHWLDVDVMRAVAGASGPVYLSNFEAKQESGTTTLVPSNSTSFKIKGDAPDQVLVDCTISDDKGTATFLVRVNIISADTDTISSTPVTVLVSPGLDTSVDVLSATLNPAGKALVIDNIKVRPSAGSTLLAAKTRNGVVRFRGATANNNAGYLGVVTYTVSDGSANGNYSATGQAFVYQLADPKNVAPIGVTDRVRIRVGEVMDLSVLDNDVGEPGLPLHIDAKDLNSDCMEGGLLFANGGKLRVVAPQKPGRYICSYTVYAEGNPSLVDSADVIFDVIGKGSGSKPNPPELIGRVNAGESVVIAVPLQSMDPDGDVVRLTAVGATKDAMGYASISPERNSIIFTARPNVGGQDSFIYEVEDAAGNNNRGIVRVGILNAEADTAPVTLVDYAEVVAGVNNKTVIDPLANDFDPRGESLTLLKDKLTPDAPLNSELYRVMKNSIGKISGSQVTFKATDKPMTLTYNYFVSNESGSISSGKIIVKVAAKAGLYFPEVTDTYVSLAEIGKLRTGIDVVSKKVVWAAGDVNSLKLSIWGDAKGLKVTGKKISGPEPEKGAVVIFKLTGKDFGGNEVVAYGLLHLPSKEFLLALDPNKARQEVKENKSVTFDLRTLLALPANLQIELDTKNLKSLETRPNAKCTASGTKITYAAGAGEPWEDGCVIPVRVKGGTEYSTLLVPVTVIPENPEPTLSRSQITVIPGKSYAADFDLSTITRWVQRENQIKNLDYNFDDHGSRYFSITKSGQILNIQADANAPVGAEESVTITVVGHPKTKPADITLVVGDAPNSNPIGGNLELNCHGKDGTCSVDVSKLQNSFNAYPGTPLKFAPFDYRLGTPNYASKGNKETCPPNVTLVASATKLTATWDKATTASVICNHITFQVIDREGAAGKGTLSFELSGVPGQVGAVRQTGYTRTKVKIEINAGKIPSNPEVEGYRVFEGGNLVTTCDMKRVGESITSCWISVSGPYDGVDKSKLHEYEIAAYNSEGDAPKSQRRIVSNVYAYVPPKRITSDIFVSVVSKTTGGSINTQQGVATVTISPVEDTLVRTYEITSETGDKKIQTLTGFGNFTLDITAKPGLGSRITARAIASIPPPGISVTPDAVATWTGRVAGGPSMTDISATLYGQRSPYAGKIKVTVNRNYSGKPAKIIYVLWSGERTPTCVWNTKDETLTLANAPSDTTVTYADTDVDTNAQVNTLESPDMAPLKDFTNYHSKVCYTNGYGSRAVELTGNDLSTLGDPADGVYLYKVASTPVALVPGPGWIWAVQLDNPPTPPAGIAAQFNGSKTNPNDWRDTIYSTYFGETPKIRVRYCKTPAMTVCSAGERLVTASDSTREWQMKITRGFLLDESGRETTTCLADTNLYLGLEGEGLTSGSTPNWIGGQLGQGSRARYSTDGKIWVAIPGVYDYFRLDQDIAPLAKYLKFFIKGDDSLAPVSGLTGKAEVVFEVSCG